MRSTEAILLHNKDGSILLGVVSIIGIIPMMQFTSFQELRRFAMGLLGCCEFFSPEIPEVYLRAFSKEDNNGT